MADPSPHQGTNTAQESCKPPHTVRIRISSTLQQKSVDVTGHAHHAHDAAGADHGVSGEDIHAGRSADNLTKRPSVKVVTTQVAESARG
jgi:hypothetical protein